MGFVGWRGFFQFLGSVGTEFFFGGGGEAMGMVGAPTGVSRGCAPKMFRGGNGKCGVEDEWKLKESEGLVKAVEDDVGELAEWWGRALLKKTDTEEKGTPILGLPDDVMTLVLARLPRQSLAMARLVCSSWKRVAEQQELASLRRKVNNSFPWLLHFYNFISKRMWLSNPSLYDCGIDF